MKKLALLAFLFFPYQATAAKVSFSHAPFTGITVSSFTLLNQTTVYLNNNDIRITMPSSSTLYHQCSELPDDSNLPLLVSSAPTLTPIGFSTVTIGATSFNPKYAILRAIITRTEDGTPSGTTLLNLQMSGNIWTTPVMGNNIPVARAVAGVTANERADAAADFKVALDTVTFNRFMFSCRTTSIETTQTCSLYLKGFCW